MDAAGALIPGKPAESSVQQANPQPPLSVGACHRHEPGPQLLVRGLYKESLDNDIHGPGISRAVLAQSLHAVSYVLINTQEKYTALAAQFHSNSRFVILLHTDARRSELGLKTRFTLKPPHDEVRSAPAPGLLHEEPLRAEDDPSGPRLEGCPARAGSQGPRVPTYPQVAQLCRKRLKSLGVRVLEACGFHSWDAREDLQFEHLQESVGRKGLVPCSSCRKGSCFLLGLRVVQQAGKRIAWKLRAMQDVDDTLVKKIRSVYWLIRAVMLKNVGTSAAFWKSVSFMMM